MAHIRPFKALRPQKDIAHLVASRPYDVLNSDEAAAEARGNPFSFLHVTKAEIDLPPGTDIYSRQVYAKAAENLRQMINRGILFKEEKSCYYIYELTVQGKSQTGLVCTSSVQDYNNNIIKKHEFTRPEKEKDRIDHITTTLAQTGNVFLAYRDVMEINAIINGWKLTNKPEYDFTASDGIQHTVWVIDSEIVIHSITRLFETLVPATYIADGHHRAASSAKVSEALPEREDAKYFLTTIFPASQLTILDYNRLVKDLNGMTSDKFKTALMNDFYITAGTEPVKPSQLHEFGMYLEGQWYILKARPGTFTSDPIGILDVTILSNNILSKLLGINDQRTDHRVDFVGGIRGLGELMRRVDSGEMKVAFSLYPITIEQLFDIADNGYVLPPKSTWFEPKLRDGLLTHLI